MSCSSGSATDTVTVALDEFSIELGASVMAAGPVDLTVANRGEFPHTLVVTTTAGDVIAATDPMQPGATIGLSLELGAGEYLFTCRIVAQRGDGTLVDHFEEGMVARASVQG